MRILAIGAHPDDIETGCGGTLIKLNKVNAEIYLLILTKGSVGGDSAIRQQEALAASDKLGVKKIYWGNFPDTMLKHDKELIDSIEKVVKEVDPDEVYMNYSDDEHQDHRNLALAAVPAVRYVEKVFMYESYSTINFKPDFFVDISGVLQEKIDLLKCHKSQLEKVSPSGLNLVDSISAFAHYRGFAARLKHAEGFKVYRYIREIN